MTFNMFAFVPVYAKANCPLCGRKIFERTKTIRTFNDGFNSLFNSFKFKQRPESEIELDFYCPRCNYKFKNKINRCDLWK